MSNMNPLQKTWMVVSTIFGAIGMVNVTEDIHKWAPFFEHIIDHYKAIWYWFFSWIPFYVADWVKDYLFFGFLIFTSTMKATFNPDELEHDGNPTLTKIATVFLMWIFSEVFWPLLLFTFCLRTFVPLNWYQNMWFLKHLGKTTEKELKGTHKIIQVIGCILLLFFVFLVVSIIING